VPAIAVLAVTVTGALLGSMVFFAAIVAPAAFRLLPDDIRPRYLGGIFPRYYLWGAIVVVLAAVASFPVSTVTAVTLAIVALAFVGVRQLLLPPWRPGIRRRLRHITSDRNRPVSPKSGSGTPAPCSRNRSMPLRSTTRRRGS